MNKNKNRGLGREPQRDWETGGTWYHRGWEGDTRSNPGDEMEGNIHNSQHLHLLHLLLGTEGQKPGNAPLLQEDISRETYQALVSPSNWKCDTRLVFPNPWLDPPTEQEGWIEEEELARLCSASLPFWRRVCPTETAFSPALPQCKSYHERRPVSVQHCPWLHTEVYNSEVQSGPLGSHSKPYPYLSVQ